LFDVAFSELVVIAVVALIVIGPEKLPKVARTLGALVGRLQRYVSTVKADIDRELQFEDLQKLQQEIKQSATKVQNDVEQSIGGAVMTAKKPNKAIDKPQ
jgi:sec-independent protein translocase protein TatB